ncbi:TetR family transcriptional regulator [soil metagenome]
MDNPQPRRGRPATVTADGLADIALGLWEERGYAAVSMGEIAAAAGVNTRTLHRYFACKSDIIWLTLSSSFDDLADALADTPGHLSVLTRVRLAILATLSTSVDIADNRRRLRIVARSTTLQSAASPPFVAWRGVIRDFASHHLDGPSAELNAEIIATAVQSVTMVTLIWWAEHGQIPPEQLVAQGLGALESGFG